MICPYCGANKTYAKATIAGFKTKRYRYCKECGRDFVTIETVYIDKEMLEYIDYMKDIGEYNAKEANVSKGFKDA